MTLQEAYEQVMKERDLAMLAKAIRDEAEADLRERIRQEVTVKVMKELEIGRT